MTLSRRQFSVSIVAAGLALEGCGPGDPGVATVAPAITTQPLSVTLTSSTATATLSVVATGGALSYQWYNGTTAIANATYPSYSTATAGTYDVVVKNSMGSVTSHTATVTVAINPVIVVQPVAASITASGATTLSVYATGIGLSYQWYFSANSTVAGTGITGATSPSVPVTQTGNYYVIVKSTNTGAQAAQSSTALVSLSTSESAPAISVQPVAASVSAGQPANFSVSATGTNLTYQWYFNGVQIQGATYNIYTIPQVIASSAGSYTVVVSNDQQPAAPVTSTAVTLTVT